MSGEVQPLDPALSAMRQQLALQQLGDKEDREQRRLQQEAFEKGLQEHVFQQAHATRPPEAMAKHLETFLAELEATRKQQADEDRLALEKQLQEASQKHAQDQKALEKRLQEAARKQQAEVLEASRKQLAQDQKALEKRLQEAARKQQAEDQEALEKRLREAAQKQQAEHDAGRKALEKRMQEFDNHLLEQKKQREVRNLRLIFIALSELRIPLDRASPAASQPGSFSEAASGAPRGDDASALSGRRSGTADGHQEGAAATSNGKSNPELTDSNARTTATTKAAGNAQKQAQAEANTAKRSKTRAIDAEADVHDHVKGEAFHLQFPFYPDRGHPVNALAHMIKKEFVHKFLKVKANELPGILVTTAQLFGADQQAAKARWDPFDIDASLDRKEGQPLLPYSVRNLMVMPKGLEVCMDKGKWVMEPVLPHEQPKGQVWHPTMWRVMVLAPDNNVDGKFDMTLLAAGGHDPISATINGVKGVHVGPFHVSLHSAEFKDACVTFESNDVAIRSLVFVYLYTLANHHCPLTNVRDLELLSAGIKRVRLWLQAARTDADGNEGARDAAATWTAPSMELVNMWLDSLDAAGDVG